jgi:hypothetical protein
MFITQAFFPFKSSLEVLDGSTTEKKIYKGEGSLGEICYPASY